MTRYQVDLNCDMGESFGNYKIGNDYEIMGEITSASIACGFHAGDFMVMDKTVRWALEKNVGVGAHPGTPDLQGFGIRDMSLTPAEVENMCLYQIGALYAFAKANNGSLQHFKMHGNLYNQAQSEAEKGNPALIEAMGKAVLRFDKDLIMLGLAGAKALDVWKSMGLRAAGEVFPDRQYNANRTLVSRSIEGSVIFDHNIVVERALKMVLENKIVAMDGTVIENVRFDSMCVHGDNPETLEALQKINKEFKKNDVAVTPLRSFIK